jgi:hypothetical protein
MKHYWFILIVLLFSCKEEVPEPVVTDYRYFPLAAGNSWTYSVTRITIDKPLNLYDTSRYYLLEQIDSCYVDNTGELAWRVVRSVRTDTASAWIVSDVWVAQIAENKAFSVEENVRYFKLWFPVTENKTWNGNMYNQLDVLNYEITSLGVPASVGSLLFDEVLTVTHRYDSSLISKDHIFEVYAYGVGLVRRDSISVDSQEQLSVYPPVPIENRVTRGIITRYKIIDYQIH